MTRGSVEGFDEVDGDDAVRVADRHPLAFAVARQQIERQAAVAAPERLDRQADVDAAGTPAGATPRAVGTSFSRAERVVGVGFAADQRVRQHRPR